MNYENSYKLNKYQKKYAGADSLEKKLFYEGKIREYSGGGIVGGGRVNVMDTKDEGYKKLCESARGLVVHYGGMLRRMEGGGWEEEVGLVNLKGKIAKLDSSVNNIERVVQGNIVKFNKADESANTNLINMERIINEFNAKINELNNNIALLKLQQMEKMRIEAKGDIEIVLKNMLEHTQLVFKNDSGKCDLQNPYIVFTEQIYETENNKNLLKLNLNLDSIVETSKTIWDELKRLDADIKIDSAHSDVLDDCGSKFIFNVTILSNPYNIVYEKSAIDAQMICTSVATNHDTTGSLINVTSYATNMDVQGP